MTIDWMHFTPWTSLAGGALIGTAAAAFILINGRITAISGIVAGVLTPRSGDQGWRLAFIAGLIAAPSLWLTFAPQIEVHVEAGTAALFAAGLLVGIGARYGSGCTSGHGICGVARLSRRSLMATATFMLTGFATVYLLRHVFAGLL